MSSHAKASTAGSDQRQATGLGRFFRGALATRASSTCVDGSGAHSHRRAPRLALLGLVLVSVLLAAAPGAAAAKNVDYWFGNATSGEQHGAGEFSLPADVAVNDSTGDVYVADENNYRIQEFDKSGAFIRAWGADVVQVGPNQADETQVVSVAATSGAFTLSFGADTTGNLSATASAAEVQAALNGLASISAGGGSVSVSGGPGDATASTPYLVRFTGGPLAGTDVAQITATNASLAGGTPASAVSTATSNPGATGFEICEAASGEFCQRGTFALQSKALGGGIQAPTGIAVDQATGRVYVADRYNQRVDVFTEDGQFLRAFGQEVVASGPGKVTARNAVQTLTVTATGGNYTLSFGGQSTGELAYSATAAEVQSALTGLTSIGSGNATVSEASAGVFTITFTGALADNPETTIVAGSATSPNELTGGTASVADTTTGASGFDVCVAANGDVCQEGASASSGGAFKSDFAGGVAVAPVGAPNAGDVLVADPANLRVQEFSSSGAFVRAFGFDVIAAGPDNSGGSFESCKASAGDACKIGVTGSGSGQFSGSVNRVAEDASGDIYTVEPATNFRVQKFTLPGNVVTPQGNFDEADLKGTASSSAPLSVAIDPSSENVLVAKAFAAGTGAPPAESAESRVLEVSPAGSLLDTHMAGNGVGSVTGIAYGPTTGRIYVSSSVYSAYRVYILDTPHAPTATISAVTSVTPTTATFNGSINPNLYPTTYRFEYSDNLGATWSSFPSGEDIALSATDSSSHAISVETPEILTPGTFYLVRLVASHHAVPIDVSDTSSTTTFTTASAPPTISRMIPEDVEQTSAKLVGYVNPNNSSTTYHFEWGAGESYGTRIPADYDPVAGSGGQPVRVVAALSGLSPAATYHFRLVAQNSSGTTEGPDGEFTTLNSHSLPDNRVPELVSPADKQPVGTSAQFAANQINYQGAENGEAMGYLILNGIKDSEQGGENMFRGERTGSGWRSIEVTPPSLVAPQTGGTFSSTVGRVRYFSPEDLKCAVVESFNPLTPDTPVADVELETSNLYRWSAASDEYTLLTNRVPRNANQNGGANAFSVAGANADCSRIFFQSKVYSYFSGEDNRIYEWANGVMRRTLLRPDGSIPTEDLIGINGNGPDSSFAQDPNRVSPDGRLFFTARSNEGKDAGEPAVFVRKSPTEVIDASQSQNGLTFGARYQSASPDGSHLFFSSNYGLAATSSSGPIDHCAAGGGGGGEVRCDIYDYNVDTGELTDISADSNPADPEGAETAGVVAVSRDGGVVYFLATGQLVPSKGGTRTQNIEEAEGYRYNLYRYSDEGLSFVARLARGDLFGGGINRYSQTTDDGRFLLYYSEAVTPLNPEGVKEAYFYSAATGETECSSCRRDGVAPKNDVDGAFGAPGTSNYVGRTLSADGRVFLESEDKLTPDAIQGDGTIYHFGLLGVRIHNNAYEWHRGQLSLLGSGAIKLLDSGGPNGRDIFIKSYEQLVGEDFDFNGDVYDFRSGGGFPEPPPPPVPCDPAADQCQGVPAAQPSGVSPPSAGFTGPGNPAPVSSNNKKKHKKHKKKHRKHRHRKSHMHNKRQHSSNRKRSHRSAHKRTQRRNAHRTASTNRGGAK